MTNRLECCMNYVYTADQVGSNSQIIQPNHISNETLGSIPSINTKVLGHCTAVLPGLDRTKHSIT